jgi:dipeptidyl aminopeptidase/acylaminoacyl peptidase
MMISLLLLHMHLLAAPREVGNLVIDGVPELPRENVERAAQYANARGATFVDWAPDGKNVLVRTRFADTHQLHTVAVAAPGADRHQVTFFPDAVAGGSYDRARPGGFYFRMDSGGNEFYQFYWFDLKTGKHTLLTDGKSRNTGMLMANAGGRFAFSSNMRDGADDDLYVYDGKTGQTRLVKEVTGTWAALDWSPDDKRLLVQHALSLGESYLFVLDLDSGELTEINPAPGKKIGYGNGVAAFARDGKNGVYVACDEDAEVLRLTFFDLATHKKEVLTPDKWDVTGLGVSNDGKWISWVVNEGGTSALWLASTADPRHPRQITLPVGVIGGGPVFDHQGTRLAFDIASSRTSSDVFTADVKTGKVTQWTQSELGGLDPDSFATPQLVQFPTFDGKQIPAWLYRPHRTDSRARVPVIVYIHGGPEVQTQPGFSGLFNFWVTELGVAVLAPNVRGSAGYGKSWMALDDGFKREDSVKDLGATLDWIATQPDLDASRVALYGGSYGGFMVLAGLSHYSDRVRCGVDVVGISNFVTFLEHTESYRRDLRRAEYGDERDPKMRAFLLSISPTTNADKITVPLFVAQGKNDPRVPASEAEQIVATVRKHGGTVWYLFAKDEGHGFQKKANSQFLNAATATFFQKFLLPLP